MMNIPQIKQPVRFVHPYQHSRLLVEIGKRGEVDAATREQIVVRLYESQPETGMQTPSVVFDGSSALERFYRTCELLSRRGVPWERYPGTGVSILSLGPQSPVPGERLQLVIYDVRDQIVRRLEEEQGECIDAGSVDFFHSSRCHPAVYKNRLVDIAPNGQKTIVDEYMRADMTRERYFSNVTWWIRCYGVPQENT